MSFIVKIIDYLGWGCRRHTQEVSEPSESTVRYLDGEWHLGGECKEPCVAYKIVSSKPLNPTELFRLTDVYHAEDC